jgi:CheY-like chemotaxis protein
MRGADPYAGALDKQFSTAPAAPDSSDPGVAALEAGLKQQAHEMAQRPEAIPESHADRIEQVFLWGVGVVAALGASLVALIALRQWNHWLDKKAAQQELARNGLVEDPVMAEFLHTLHEELWNGPVATPSEQFGPPITLPAPTAAAQKPSALKPSLQGPVPGGNNLALLRAELQRLSRAPDDDERLRVLRELLEGAELIKQSSDLPHLRSAKLLASALHGLLKQLSLKAAHITPSVLRTAAAAVDLLEFLSARTPRPDLANAPPVRLLAVDDEPISLRAVAFALKKAFNGSDVAVDGQSALALAIQQPYDVIFLDIEMPGMDGFELCAKIHETAANRTTPVVFVTSHTDFDSRAKCALLGAQDLIAKPFLAFEITLKALTLVLRAREERESKSAQNEHETPDVEMPTAAPAVMHAALAAAVPSA